ncbi:MAG TPA: DUF6569 family protein [Kofleriaceae bacterium]|nr:DUF6569 family protein [Kofleriaceae bacterium]
MLLAFVVCMTACGGDDGVTPNMRDARDQVASGPTPKPKPKPIDLSLGAGFEMRHPIREGNLMVIPIVTTAAVPAVHYVTLADGIAAHTVTVREIARGQDFEVDHVRVRNKGREPLFVMTGELIYDGLQDRAIAEDRLIPPGASVKVEVRCVEQGREAGHMAFRAGNVLAELGLRQQMVFATQQDVWTKVEQINTAHRLTPPTKTYRDAAELQHATDAMAKRTELAHQLAALPDRDRLVGLALVVNNAVVEADRFATPELYGAFESELLGAYIASDGLPPHEGKTLVPDDVRAFFDPAHPQDTWSGKTSRRVTDASLIIMSSP